MEKDFVSEETKTRIAEIKAEFEKAKMELEELERPYKGGATEAQQRTMDKLKMIDANYQSRKKTIQAKLQYLQAAYDEAKLKASFEQERGYKRWLDAVSDFY